MLTHEMQKIDHMIKEDKLTDYQKVRRQLREKGGGDKDVDTKLFEMKSKKFTAPFKTYTRDQRNNIFRDRTQAPAVGLYHPKKEVVWAKPRDSHFDPHHENADKALKIKFDTAKVNASKISKYFFNLTSPRRASVIKPAKKTLESTLESPLNTHNQVDTKNSANK